MTDRPLDAYADDSNDDASLVPADAAGLGEFDFTLEDREGLSERTGDAEDAGAEAGLADDFAEVLPSGTDLREKDADDAAMILDAPGGMADPLAVPMRWDAYASAHHIGIELKHLEDEVRDLLEPIDQRRKRKFSGTRRWHELEDDLRAIRFSGRLPEATIAKILQLIAKRHSLYGRLSFLSATRPTWNT